MLCHIPIFSNNVQHYKRHLLLFFDAKFESDVQTARDRLDVWQYGYATYIIHIIISYYDHHRHAQKLVDIARHHHRIAMCHIIHFPYTMKY